MTRTIGVVTTNRADYGILRPVMLAIRGNPSLQLRIFTAGHHQLADGFVADEVVDMLPGHDCPTAIARSMGLHTLGFADALARTRPSILLVCGDRYEMHSAAVAALPQKIPTAHIHGGEISWGAIDDSLRHSITKLAHLHFVATRQSAQRIAQMGEEDWRITVSGAPSLDNGRGMSFYTCRELAELGVFVTEETLLVTFHPTTLEYESVSYQVEHLLAALEMTQRPVLFTGTNTDTFGGMVSRRVREYVDSHPNAELYETLGWQVYFSVMSNAAAMVGNSSSGIVEAASFGLPVINVGNRQAGRQRARNVISVPADSVAIRDAICRATGEEFRDSLKALKNPYDKGGAAKIICARLAEVSLDQQLIVKKFQDG